MTNKFIKYLENIIKYLKIFVYLIVVVFIIYIVFNIIQYNKGGNIGNIKTNITTGELVDSVIGYLGNKLEIDDECNIINSGGYEVYPIFTETKTGFDTSDYKSYTEYFNVSKGFKEAFFCVLADVKPNLKNSDGKYYLYVLVNWGYMGGLVNVGYSKTNNTPYDYTTSVNKELNGRMYGLETPKKYFIDLKRMIVANTEGGGYKIISPIDQLNKGGKQRIGGMVSAGENGIIRKFVLIHKGGALERINEE